MLNLPAGQANLFTHYFYCFLVLVNLRFQHLPNSNF
jgi:hypothetical protein